MIEIQSFMNFTSYSWNQQQNWQFQMNGNVNKTQNPHVKRQESCTTSKRPLYLALSVLSGSLHQNRTFSVLKQSQPQSPAQGVRVNDSDKLIATQEGFPAPRGFRWSSTPLEPGQSCLLYLLMTLLYLVVDNLRRNLDQRRPNDNEKQRVVFTWPSCFTDHLN